MAQALQAFEAALSSTHGTDSQQEKTRIAEADSGFDTSVSLSAQS